MYCKIAENRACVCAHTHILLFYSKATSLLPHDPGQWIQLFSHPLAPQFQITTVLNHMATISLFFIVFYKVCIPRHCTVNHLKNFWYSLNLLIYSLLLLLFFFPPYSFSVEEPGQSLNFSDCTLMLKFSMFFNPIYLLQLGSWFRGLVRLWSKPFGITIGSVVVFPSGGGALLVFCLFRC